MALKTAMALAAGLILSGCAARYTPTPLAANFPITKQAKLQAAYHWGVVSSSVEKRLVETVDLLSFVASDTMIAAEIRVTLDPLEDWPDFGPAPLVKGERKQSLVFLFYDVADGQFTRIRSARFRRIEQG